MKRPLTALLLTLGAFMAAAVPATAQSTVSFTDTYSGWNSFTSCSSRQNVYGQEPADGGRHPVWVHLHGYTGELSSEYSIMIQEAAKLGFVAIAPRYSSFLSGSTSGVENQSRCIYGSGSGSALTKVCARPEADCAKGVVVSGLSLGSTISARAANVSGQVRAAYLLGFTGPSTPDLFGPGVGSRALPNDRMRLTFGRRDVTSFDTVNRLTGRSCATGPDCLAPDGSGWYAVQDADVFDHVADHCFHFYRYGCLGQQAPFDPGWRPPSTKPWALLPGLTWAKQFTSA